MSGEIHKCTGDRVNDICSGRTVNVAKIAVAQNTQATTFSSPATANPLAERLTRLRRKIEEEGHWSPTQQEIDAYIDSLEQELLQSCEVMPERPGNRYKGAAPIKGRPSDSYTLVWWLLAMAAGCFLGLARIILKALN